MKGLWLYYCANNAQLEKHAKKPKGKEVSELGVRISQLLKTDLPEVIPKSLDQVRSRYWDTLSSLAHVGHAQVRNWLNPDGVKARYPLAALEELANFANFMALVAGRELAHRAGNSEHVELLTDMLPPSLV